MYEESDLEKILRKWPGLPAVLVAVVFMYLFIAWGLFYLVDARNLLGSRYFLEVTGALAPPVIWYSLFREGGCCRGRRMPWIVHIHGGRSSDPGVAQEAVRWICLEI